MGAEPATEGPDEFRVLLRNETERWGSIARKSLRPGGVNFVVDGRQDSDAASLPINPRPKRAGQDGNSDLNDCFVRIQRLLRAIVADGSGSTAGIDAI